MLAKLLVVEDQRITRRMICLWFEKYEGWSVVEAATLTEAIHLLRSDTFDCIILDLNLKDSEGMDTFNAINALTTAPIVVYTAHADDAMKKEVLDGGACGVISKTIGTELDMQDAIVGCIARRRSQDGTSLLVKKSRRAKVLTWIGGLAGSAGFIAAAAWDAYLQYKSNGTYSPPDWVIAILTSSVGVAAYKSAQPKK